jgi:hypothetical protein
MFTYNIAILRDKKVLFQKSIFIFFHRDSKKYYKYLKFQKSFLAEFFDVVEMHKKICSCREKKFNKVLEI